MIVDNIRVRCRLRGITIAQVERDLSLSHGAISKWDTSDPGVSKVKAVADYFGTTIDELIK